MLSSYEEIASQWHPTKNKGLTPDKVKANSIEKYWFLCPNTCDNGCLHEWLTTPQSRTLKNTGCPYCAKGSTVICIHQSLANKHEDLMDEWNYDKNINTDPTKIRPGSDKKVHWICKVCAMEWEAAIKARAKGSGCPGCNGKVGVKPVTKMNSLEGKFPEIAKEWHPTKNGDKLPSAYKYGSLEKVWWLCPNTCGYEGCIQHEYEKTINARTNAYGGSGCPYCSTTTPKICYHQSLEHRFPEIAKLWHPTKNTFKPSEVSPFNNRLVWWICLNRCDQGFMYEYQQIISNKTIHNVRCPKCQNRKNYSKISLEWIKYLEINHKIQHAENGGEFCIPNTKYRADGYCHDTNTVYEFLGDLWHGNPKMFKMDEMNKVINMTYGELYNKTIQKRDKLIELGYNYVEVWEKDWKDGIKALRKIQRKWMKRTKTLSS
jgi:hypothetical protein